MKLKQLTLKILLIILLGLCACQQQSVAPSLSTDVPPTPMAGTIVKVQPSVQSVQVGKLIQVTIDVVDVVDLYGVELEITFDPALLKVVDANRDKQEIQIEHGDFLSSDFVAINNVDATQGVISYAVTQISPTPSKSGNGTLAVVTFMAENAGEAEIGLDGVFLATSEGESIQIETLDGIISVKD